MMERFWRATGVALGKHWKIVAVVVVLITGVLAIGTSKIEFATGQDSYLNSDSQVAIDNVEYQGKFGGETVVLLYTAEEGSDSDVSDLFAGPNLDTMKRLNDELDAIEEVASVITPYTSLIWSDALVRGAGRDALLAAAGRDPDPAGIEARNADITIALARLGAVETQEIGDQTWNELLIFGNDGFTVDDGAPVPPADDERAIRLSLASTFPNQQTAVGGVVLEGNASLDEQSAGTQKVLDVLENAEFDGFDLTITGSPVYLKEINDYLKGGMLTLGVMAIIVMAIVLSVMFSVRWRLLPLVAVLIGVLWSFSILGLIGINLSLVTIAGLPILIGLGIEFAIQIHNRVEEEVVLDNEAHFMGETLANMAPPLIAATITGIVAFAALQISKVPMIRDFGVLLGIGVAVLVIVGIVVPATTLGIREWKKPTKTRGRSRVERIVVWLGSIRSKWGPAMVIAAVVLFVGGILVEGRTKIESDPIKWIDQGSQTVADVNSLVEHTGFETTLGILIEANNVYDQDVIDLIHRFTLAAEARPEIATSSSLVNTMGKIIAVEGASELPPTSEEIIAAAAVMPDAIRQALVSPSDPSVEVKTSTQINLRLAPAGLDERAVIVEELRVDLERMIDELDVPTDSVLFTGLPLDQEPVRAVPAGLATVGIGLLENLEANRAALTYLALSLAALYLTLRHRSLTRGLIALVPVCLAVGASALIVGLLGLELSPLTTVSGPLVTATCAEFSVLILGRYLEERQTGLPPRVAVDTAASRTGRAFFTSACTTIGGFAVLIGSALPLLRDFGIIVTMNVATAVLAALVVMPPLMVWVDERGWLGTEEQQHHHSVRLAAVLPGSQTPFAAVGAVALAAGAVGIYAGADTSTGEASVISYAAVALPTTTTTSTTTTTTTTTTLAPGVEPPPSTEPAGPEVDPSGFPTEPPTTPIAAILFQRLLDEGVAPNVANCGITTAYEEVDENGLIEMGIATLEPEPVAVVTRGALKCGITQETIDAAIEAQRSGG
jgi:hydrophobe/amphiphile efflux-3 (HAE3) family protein